MSMSEQPNLFNFATSELSQDAFICWLLSWAAPGNREFDQKLHECAKRLLDIFFDKHSKGKPPSYNCVEVRKQDNFIDILCIINYDIYILIEDKTWTKNHSDQLRRYVDNIKSKNISESKILPIYFKTGDQSDYREIHKNGYIVFSRSDFLKVLNAGHMTGITNQIFLDYRNHLQKIDNEVNSYKILPVSEWKWESWKGFFIELQQLLKDGNWDYVPNPSGGFLGFWWHFQGDDQCEQYLQLEQVKCCFKIWVNDSSQRAKLRNQWHRTIHDIGRGLGINIVKPQRFGNGQYMTVAILDEEYRKENTDGTVDMHSTVDFLKKAEIVLKTIAADKHITRT